MGIKPKTSFRHYIPTHLPRWFAMLAPHIPHRIGKKVASRKKSRLRRKKPAYRKKSYSIVWKACPCHRLCLRLRHPRSAIPSIASIVSIVSIAHRPASPYMAVRRAIGAVFFRRSRLFLREAAFFSGGEGCEWGAKQPTVGSEWGYNDENSFSALYPFACSR